MDRVRVNSRRLISLVTAGLALAACAGGPATRPAQEVASELGDLWRQRDAFYLRVDDRRPTTPGLAERGTSQIVIKTEAMARGRPWPGRWTVLEVEVRPSADQVLILGLSNQKERFITRLRAGRNEDGTSAGPSGWVALRVPIGRSAQDLVISPEGLLAGPMEFRRVRLVDDRWVVWEEGWSILREAGRMMFRRQEGEEITLDASVVEVEEVGAVRARVRIEGKSATIYASGRLASEPGLQLGDASLGKVSVEISDDQGRLLRNTPGDADGDGYNEARGSMMLRGVSKHVTLTLAPPAGVEKVDRPAIEIQGLPEGPATVLWEGSVVKTTDRLPDGSLLVEIPATIRGPSRLEVHVGQ